MAEAQPQPIKAVLAARGISLPSLARAIGYSHFTVWAVANGQQQGGPVFRSAVCEYLELPEDQLFRPHKVKKTGVKPKARAS